MGDYGSAIAWSVVVDGGLDGVQSLSDSGVPDRMDVDLEAR
jgi:hypothetical protein